MYKKILFLLAFLSSTCLLHASSGSLVVGTNAEFPPFTYIEEGIIVGFDIDVATEVARRQDKSIRFKDMPFDALISELVLGHVDFVAAGMSYTEERAKRVAFTKNYLSENPLVIFSTERNLTLADLAKKNVVVIEGFFADFFISSQPGIDPVRLPTQADGFMAIKSGRADAFVTAKSTVDAFLETQKASQFHTTIIEGSAESCALVVAKNNHKMLAEIQGALDSMEADGTMAEIKAKWKL